MSKAELRLESWPVANSPAKPSGEDDKTHIWAALPVRTAIASTVLFQVVQLWSVLVRFPQFARPVAPILIGELAITVVLLAQSWKQSVHEGWRGMVLAWSAVLVVSAAMVGLIAHQMTGCFLALIIMLLGTAALVPWGVRWQSWLALVCLAVAVVTVRVAPQPSDGFQLDRLLELATAAAVSLFLAALAQHYRENVKSRVQTLERTLEAVLAAERTDEAARAAAEAASHAKSEFLASMSHEIRTPMSAILGAAEVLADSELNSDQRKYLAIMMNNGNALLDLLNGVLDLARIESGQLTLERTGFSLNDVAEDAVESLMLRARQKGLELLVAIAPQTPTVVTGDSIRIRQVLINLLNNAIKFTPAGRVTLEIRPEDANGAIRFVVRDTGIGISQDQLGKIFTSYAQAESSTARRYGGSGLGLAIVNQLVQLMGGRLTVESEVGRGSAFQVIVPLGVAEKLAGSASLTSAPRLNRAASAVSRESLQTALGHLPRILVADDSRDNRLLIEALLSKTGCIVDQAENGAVAVKKFQQNRYDVILMDIQMPEVDGYTAVLRIREWERARGLTRTPIIALTASVLGEAVERTRQVGCDAFVTKPVRHERLIAAIGEVIDARPDTPALLAPNS
jgi:signal transduction histidine kinase